MKIHHRIGWLDLKCFHQQCVIQYMTRGKDRKKRHCIVIDLLRARLKSCNKGGNKQISYCCLKDNVVVCTVNKMWIVLPMFSDKKSSCYDHIICYPFCEKLLLYGLLSRRTAAGPRKRRISWTSPWTIQRPIGLQPRSRLASEATWPVRRWSRRTKQKGRRWAALGMCWTAARGPQVSGVDPWGKTRSQNTVKEGITASYCKDGNRCSHR